MVSRARQVTAAALLGALCFSMPGVALMSRECRHGGGTRCRHSGGNQQSKTADGLTVYVGVVPAEIVKGPPTHVLLSKGPHEYQIISKSPHEYDIVAAIFDATSGERVSDGVVTAEVSGLGLSGSKTQLEPMQIAGTTAYGGFFDLPGSDLYIVKLTVRARRGETGCAAIQVRSPPVDRFVKATTSGRNACSCPVPNVITVRAGAERMRQPMLPIRRRSSPGNNRNAKGRPPAVHATIILLTVLVESAARIGDTASAGLIFPDATSEAIETAAECVSAKPANAAPTITPVSPKFSRRAAEITRTRTRSPPG